MHYAASRHDIEDIKLLVSLGDNVYAENNVGETPWHYARLSGDNTDAVNAALRAGSYIDSYGDHSPTDDGNELYIDPTEILADGNIVID